MQQVPTEPDTEYFTARRTCERYGSITSMTLWRWINDEAMDFPPPYYFGRIRFWKLAELQAWEAKQPRRKTDPEATSTDAMLAEAAEEEEARKRLAMVAKSAKRDDTEAVCDSPEVA